MLLPKMKFTKCLAFVSTLNISIQLCAFSVIHLNIEKCVSNVDVHFGMKIEFRLKWIYTIIKIDLTNMI